jgi:hypothetical protein
MAAAMRQQKVKQQQHKLQLRQGSCCMLAAGRAAARSQAVFATATSPAALPHLFGVHVGAVPSCHAVCSWRQQQC